MKTRLMLLLPALAVAVPAAQAQTGKWPDKPVRVVVPFAPGGSTDIIARVLTARLSQEFGQQFIVDNRSGAGGSLGTDIVVRANPDGYTVIIVATSYATNAALYKLSYDPVRDIAPVAMLHKGMPREIIARLNQSLARILKQPETQERLRTDGRQPAHSTPDEFARVIAREITKWEKVVKVGNIKVN